MNASMSENQIHKLIACFNDKYAALYEGDLKLPLGLWNDLLDRFDGHKYNREVLLHFNRIRQDVVSSDREVVAFMLAYDELIDA